MALCVCVQAPGESKEVKSPAAKGISVPVTGRAPLSQYFDVIKAQVQYLGEEGQLLLCCRCVVVVFVFC